jgi:Zn-dependent membrane protease YugP
MYFGPAMHDPVYLIIMVIGMALVFLPQMWVKNTVARFSEVHTARNFSGREIAQRILSEHGLSQVSVEMVDGFLSDHYDPAAKAVRLSSDVYQGHSIASVAIAAHECGHAIQHAKGYLPVVIRSSMAPVVGFGSSIGPWLLIIAFGLGASATIMPGWAYNLAWVGVILYGLAVAFHVVTLPVELDASGRALKVLETQQYLSRDEMSGAKKVLTAAAFTYIAAALYALMELIYWVSRLMGSRRND